MSFDNPYSSEQPTTPSQPWPPYTAPGQPTHNNVPYTAPPPPDKPFYKKMWFIIVASVSGLLIACCACGAVGAAIGGSSTTHSTSSGAAINKSTLVTATKTPTAAVTASPTPAATSTKPALATATSAPIQAPKSSTATPIPARPPTATPVPHLFIQFTCADAVDNNYGEVCVHTQPGASLSITVQYCSGHDATSRSLQGTVTADGAGNYTWTWTPQTSCMGSATATVDASWHGQSLENSDSFNVS